MSLSAQYGETTATVVHVNTKKGFGFARAVDENLFIPHDLVERHSARLAPGVTLKAAYGPPPRGKTCKVVTEIISVDPPPTPESVVVRYEGHVLFFKAELGERGYGFVDCSAFEKNVFLGAKEVAKANLAPKGGDSISFEVVKGQKGPMAKSVAMLEASGGGSQKKKRSKKERP
jgi:cold shock CspA family protein